MSLAVSVGIPAFVDESVVLAKDTDNFRIGRSRIVQGTSTGRPYLLRWGLLEAIAERLYYQWASYRMVGVRPVQFFSVRYRRRRRVRNLAAIWWTDGEIETERISKSASESMVKPEPETLNAGDIPRAMALDLFLDNCSRFAGWMFEGGRAYRLFNHQALGLGSGAVSLITRIRLINQRGICPKLDIEAVTSSMGLEEKAYFMAEAVALSTVSDEDVIRLCRLPQAVCEEAFELCVKSLGNRDGGRETRKMFMAHGPSFIEGYATEYILSRRRELSAQLRLCERA